MIQNVSFSSKADLNWVKSTLKEQTPTKAYHSIEQHLKKQSIDLTRSEYNEAVSTAKQADLNDPDRKFFKVKGNPALDAVRLIGKKLGF